MSWLIQYCTTPGCRVTIRIQAGQQEPVPVCKWCLAGTAYRLDRTWPDGMPNPDNPWPWLTDKERAEQIRLSFWQERFRASNMYATLAARRA